MPYLNLAPDIQKQRVHKERVFLLAHNIIGIILVTVSVASILLTVARFVLIRHYERIRDDTSLVNVEHQTLRTNVTKLNKKIETASAIQKHFVKWSLLLEDATALAPGGVALNFLHANRESDSIRITGQADNREVLVAFKEALESSNFISSLEAPLSNLLEQVNVNFRFAAKLKKDIYNRPQ